MNNQATHTRGLIVHTETTPNCQRADIFCHVKRYIYTRTLQKLRSASALLVKLFCASQPGLRLQPMPNLAPNQTDTHDKTHPPGATMVPFRTAAWMFCTLSLVAQSERSVSEWKTRYPYAKTAYTLWEMKLEEQPMGFWKAPKDHSIQNHRKSLVLKADSYASRQFRHRVPRGSTLTEAWVSWTLPNGKTEKVDKDKFKKEEQGWHCIYSYQLPELPEGTQIEEYLEAKVIGAAWGNQSQEFPENVPIQRCHLEAIIQDNKGFRVKNPLAEEGKGTREIKKHADDKRWVITLDLPEFGPSLERVPLSRPPVAPKALALQIVEAPIAVAGGIQYHFFRSPTATISNLYSTAAARTPWFSKVVEQQLEELIKGQTTNRGKVEAIFKYLNTEIKLIPSSEESGSIFSDNYRLDFADMLTKKKGTPAAIAALMNQMLQKLDIDSKLILIHGGAISQFDPGCMEPSEIWNMAVMVDLDGAPVILMPQDKDRPMGQLDHWLMDRPAIVIRKTDELQIIRTPSSQAFNNQYEETWKLTIEPTGMGNLHFERVATGPENASTRRLYNGLPERMKPLASSIWNLAYATPPFRPDRGTIANVEALDKPILFGFDFALPKVCGLKDNLITLTPRSTSFPYGMDTFVPMEHRERKVPIWIPYDQTTHRTLTIQAPVNWRLHTPLPASTQVKNSLGSASVAYAMEGATIKVDQTLTLLHGLHAATLSTELEALVGENSPLVLPAFQFK